jgi:heptosyltransferase-3
MLAPGWAMRLLFVKLKHIGDALLLTPTLSAVRQSYPAAQIWVVVRRGTEGILAGCPEIDHLCVTASPESHRRRSRDLLADLRLLRRLRSQHFDYAFELSHGDRGRMLVWLSGARVKVANHGVYPLGRFWRQRFTRLSTVDWSALHRAEADFRVVAECLPLSVGEIPGLVFSARLTETCDLPVGDVPCAVLHPGTRWQRKRWPPQHWVELGERLSGRFTRLVISVGPDPAEQAMGRSIASRLPPGSICTDGNLSWRQLAGLLYRAQLFVGVDTAAMHLAAACQCPTVAIFGPSPEALWRPWRCPHRLVSPAGMADEGRATGLVSVDAVWRACESILAEGRRG